MNATLNAMGENRATAATFEEAMEQAKCRLFGGTQDGHMLTILL
jgi:hypothetical protein